MQEFSVILINFVHFYFFLKGITLPETNTAPDNQWLEDEIPLGKPYLRGLC